MMAIERKTAASRCNAGDIEAARRNLRHAETPILLGVTTIEINRLSHNNIKNGKSENAKRSEPNIGQIPGPAASPPAGSVAPAEPACIQRAVTGKQGL
jgi:hypothetical protein